jgi:NADPH-dependent curcumin reductase CurA
MTHTRRWYFNKRPTRSIEDDTFELREQTLPPLAEGELLLRSIYLSMDATNRLWLGDWDLYMDPVLPGEPMKGFTLCEVVASRNSAFAVGSLAAGLAPWSDYSISDGSGLMPVPRIPGLALADAFGVLAVAGPTALVGLMEIGRPQPGATVVVTAAAGAVGMLVGQIAKIHGCKTIGIAGGPDKCASLVERFGYDHAIDYKREDVVARLRALAPDGVDVHFENVGGEMLDAGLTVMKNFGSVVICGLISTYNSTAGDRIPAARRRLCDPRLPRPLSAVPGPARRLDARRQAALPARCHRRSRQRGGRAEDALHRRQQRQGAGADRQRALTANR